MQAKLGRGKAAFCTRSVGLSVATLASVPLIAILALCAPDQALAARCGASAPMGVHPSGGGGVAGVHALTSRPATSGGGGGGGGGTLGCANGASNSLRGLPMAGSGRVIQPGAHAAHTAMRPTTRTTTHASAPMHFARPHRA
jgi:hypothetical protein